jgi:hypothetical protein
VLLLLIFKKLPRENNRPLVENSPNLVTLAHGANFVCLQKLAKYLADGAANKKLPIHSANKIKMASPPTHPLLPI